MSNRPGRGYQHQQRLRESLSAKQDDLDAPKMAGRGLPGRQAPVPIAPQAPHGPQSVGGMKAAVPGGTPFANAQVDVGTNVAPSSANSFQVMTIVLGTLTMIAAAVLASTVVIVVGYLGWIRQNVNGPQQANTKGHVRDTGLVEEVDPDLLKMRQRYRAQKAQIEEDGGDPLAEMFGGIGGAPVTVFASGPLSEEYHGIEVWCDRVPGFRERAPLRKLADGRKKAHIPIIPATKCRLVFQGNVPVRTYVTGGDVANCTFQPLTCR